MKHSLFATTGALALLAGSVSAQGLSGTIDLSYGYVDASNDRTYTENLLGADVSVDFETASGWYFGGEAAYEEATGIVGSTHYLRGTTLTLRAGNSFGWGTGEIFAGYLNGESNDGAAERFFVGLSAGKALSNKFSLNGQIGYLDGEDDNGIATFEDMLSQAVFASFGGRYNINDAFSLDMAVSGAIGVMDQDNERGDIGEVSLGLNYTLPNSPAWTLYTDAKYTYYFQHNENDQEDIMTLGLGVSYSFGAPSPRDVLGDSLPLAQWASVMEGVLE